MKRTVRHINLGIGLLILSALITGCMNSNFYPETPVGHFRLADQHVLAQNYEDAITVYERIVLIYGDTEHADLANFEIARIYHGFLRDYSSAANYYERVLYEGPESEWDPEALYRLAALYERDVQDYSKAKVMYAQLMNEYPGSEHRNEAQSAINRIQGMGF